MNVLVTGSTRGIGFAIAKRFAQEGHTVFVNGRNKVFEAAEQLKGVACPADVTNREEVRGLIWNIEKEYGCIDVLVNNAGIAGVGLFQKTYNVREILETNALGAMYCAQVALPAMVARKRGCIINVSSVWGNAGAAGEVAYSASKGAVNAFTRALAKEVAPCGIRVNAVAPGVIDTEMNDCLSDEEKVDLCEKIPMGRFGLPSEVADAVYFLASDAARYITGQILTVSGGFE